MYIQHVAMIVW